MTPLPAPITAPDAGLPAPPTDLARPTTGRSRSAYLLWLLAGVLTLLAAWSYGTQGLVFDLLRSDWNAEQRVERLKSFFHDCGPWAPVAYTGFVTLEVVVAPIPGLMLYAPGGLIFGPWLGGALALLGNALGSGVACVLARSVSSRWVEDSCSAPSSQRLQCALERRGSWLIFLLRLNPLTSSDLLSWVAGLTRIPVWQVMLATGLGMAPLCFGQSWLSDQLFTRLPQLIYPLLAAGVLYIAVVIVILQRLLRPAATTRPQATESAPLTPPADSAPSR